MEDETGPRSRHSAAAVASCRRAPVLIRGLVFAEDDGIATAQDPFPFNLRLPLDEPSRNEKEQVFYAYRVIVKGLV